jgi:hypothetical protein
MSTYSVGLAINAVHLQEGKTKKFVLCRTVTVVTSGCGSLSGRALCACGLTLRLSLYVGIIYAFCYQGDYRLRLGRRNVSWTASGVF